MNNLIFPLECWSARFVHNLQSLISAAGAKIFALGKFPVCLPPVSNKKFGQHQMAMMESQGADAL